MTALAYRPVRPRVDRACALCWQSIAAGEQAASVPAPHGRRGWMHLACAQNPDAAIFGQARRRAS